MSTNPPAPPDRWPNITALLADTGHITIGHVAHIEGVAIAANVHTVFATVVRREGESVEQLLQRLDEAIGRAVRDGVYTNEAEGGHFVLASPEKG